MATVIGFSVAASALRKRNDGERSPDELFLFALFLLVVFLKGTSPGGRKAYKQFKAASPPRRHDPPSTATRCETTPGL